MEHYQLKFVVLGEAGVGKTSLLNQYVKRSFSQYYKATIGADFLASKITVDEKQVDLQLWDTAGQERFHSLSLGFYRGADCCIIVFDVTNQTSFANIESWINEFLQKANPIDPESFPFIIFANKCDVSEERVVPSETINSFCQNKGFVYYEVSAKENINVDEAFENATRKALERGRHDL